MQFYDALEEMAKTAGRSIYSIQKELNRGNTLVASKSRGSILRSDTLAKVAEVCGYALVLVPEDSMPEGAIAIEPDQR